MWQIVLSGPGYLDTEYELPEGDTRLGRSEENDVVLSGERVSRRHARLRVERGGVTVLDEGSRNGTRVNGARLDGAAAVVAGDVITIGDNRILLRSASSPLERAAPALPRLRDVTDRLPLPATAPVLLRRSVEDSGAIEGLERARSLGPGRVLDESAPELASLILLYQVSEKLAKASTLHAFLEDVVELVLEVAHARAVVALLADASGALNPAVVRQRGGGGEVPLSRSAVDECVRSRVALCIADAGSDERFAQRDSVVLHDISQILCVPLWEDDEVVGALYLTRDPDDLHLPKLVDTLVAIAHLAASGIRQQRLRERAAEDLRVRRVLERFHAPDIVDRVVRDLGGGPGMEERTATILFADISGFTRLTESLPAARIVKLLDDFYRRMSALTFSFGGTIDKFIGDAVMAIFGAPYARGDDPARAVRAALAMQLEFGALMAARPEVERTGLKIGINTGRVLAGTVGGDARLEYTAVGDAVNVAARLTSTAAAGEVLVTSSTLQQLRGRFSAKPLGERVLRGRTEPVHVYAIDGEDPGLPTLPVGTIPDLGGEPS